MAWYRIEGGEITGMHDSPSHPAQGQWVSGPKGTVDEASGDWTVRLENGQVVAKGEAELDGERQAAAAALEEQAQEKQKLKAAVEKISTLEAEVAELKAKNGEAKP